MPIFLSFIFDQPHTRVGPKLSLNSKNSELSTNLTIKSRISNGIFKLKGMIPKISFLSNFGGLMSVWESKLTS